MFATKIELRAKPLSVEKQRKLNKELESLIRDGKSYDLIKKCIDDGADVNSMCNYIVYDCSILFLAICYKNEMDVIKLLIDHTDFEKENKYPMNALHEALNKKIPETFEICSLLLDKGADIHKKSKSSYFEEVSVLYRAIDNKQSFDIIKLLLEKGAKQYINEIEKGITNLYNAVYEAHGKETIEFLLKNGADPLIKIPNRATILRVSLYHQIYDDVTQLLIDYGCDPTLKDDEDKDGLFYAISRSKFNFVYPFIEKGCKLDNKMYHLLPQKMKNDFEVDGDVYTYKPIVYSCEKQYIKNSFIDLWIPKIEKCLVDRTSFEEVMFTSTKTFDTTEELEEEFMNSTFDHRGFHNKFLPCVQNFFTHSITFTYNSVILTLNIKPIQ